jgi:hypothetical protein
MNCNNQLISEWKSSTKKIFWSTIFLFFAGVISTIYDYISYAAAIFSMVSGMASSALESLGRGPLIDMSDFVEWGLSSKGLVIIGYILYIWGLTSFASIQRLEETATQVRKIRAAGIVLAVVVMIDMVFGVLGSIPVLGWFFRLFVFIMTLYCYYKMKNAAGKLMVAEDFNDRAKRGSRNLRFAAVCEIRLMWLPLWAAIFFMIIVFGLAPMMMASIPSVSGAMKLIGLYAIVTLIIFGVFCVCFMFCAFWWPIMGWYRVMTGGPADANDNKLEIQQEPVEDEPIAEPLQESKAERLPEIEEEKKTPWLEENKKWLLPVGGVVALALLIWGAISIFGHTGKGNDLLPVQKPAWEKFVVVLNDEVAVFKEAKTISPQLQIMQENLDSDAAAQYFKWSDDSDKRGYSSSNYLLSRNKILPVVGEEGEWYKVTVSEEYVGTVDCYIQKTYCREVKPEPITPEVLNGMKSYNWYTAFYGLQTDGKLKNICFVSVMGEMEGEWLDAAVLYDGVLINPLTKRISTQLNHNENADPLVVSSENGYTCLYYSDSMTDNYVLDARKISQEAKSSKIDLNHLFESIPTSQSSIQQVSYYFPEIDKEHLFTFIQDVSGSQSSANIDGVEDKKEFSGYTFFTDKLDGMVGLYAEVDGDRRCTDIEGERIDVLDQDDYDGDGEREALVYVWGGGNAIEPPFIVYFDKETQEFKKALGFEDASDQPLINIEKWKGKPSFRVDIGLRKDRYVYENHEVKLAERIAPDLGEVISTITVKQVFGSSEEYEEKTANLDIDGYEGKEQLLFMHDTSHFLGWGKQMQLKRISGRNNGWTFPKSEDEEFQIIGSKFTFLKSDNLLMPDILCDDAWLYKWVDESYVMQ